MPGGDRAAKLVLVRDDAEVASWALKRRRADLAAVDELARLALAAKRLGCSIRLREPCAELLALLDLAGLNDAFGVAGNPGQVAGEAEGGEEPRIEEVVVPDDPVA